MTDFISLPFYDLFHASAHVPEVLENLAPLVSEVRRSILEIGAGTGLITTSLADWTPAEIFAVEPSAGMRGVLLSRLSARPELLSRVTVLPCDALSVRLPEPAEAVVMINVLYSLDPGYRRRLWPVLAALLEAGGRLIFTWRPGGHRSLARCGSSSHARWAGTRIRPWRRSSPLTARQRVPATSTGSLTATTSSARKRSRAAPTARRGTCWSAR